MAGLNNRVPGLALADVQGALGFARDDASWLNTAYAAGELAAMPFAMWFAITFSLRSFHLAMLAAAVCLSALMPLVQDLHLLISLRAVQGLCSGTFIPMLMGAALGLLPPSVRLHGLALYALTATFSPNVALWLAALCVDRLEDWRWVYWHVIPIGLLAMGLVAWGLPQKPAVPTRLREGDWLGMALGIPGLALLVIGLDQGVRLDWFRSPLVVASLLLGTVLTVLFLVSELRHPAPFVRLQILERRNLWLGFTVFVLLLMISTTAVVLPANFLGALQGFRLAQTSALGLVVGLPQLLLGSCVALLLYQRWIDARHVFAAGLACIAAACWLGSGITSEWMVAQLVRAEVLYAAGLPMAIVSLLFLATSAVQPVEGAYVAGIVNTLRALGSVLGGAVIGQLLVVRTRFHNEMLLDQAGHTLARLPSAGSGLPALAETVAREASVLAAADVYRVFGLLALLLIPVVLKLQCMAPPAVRARDAALPPAHEAATGANP
ncbi:Multidrug resistance protein B [Variovorax sp. WDL1]|nr:putative multidrug resistance protein EmrY [Variovorax sp. B4]PNG60299.1 putative multidrug resistance protein EmrY [Variovorax sp. B2]VTV13854.1 Multidrug resistance protein B [Variovorax sp. WDL1]